MMMKLKLMINLIKKKWNINCSKELENNMICIYKKRRIIYVLENLLLILINEILFISYVNLKLQFIFKIKKRFNYFYNNHY